MIRLRIGPIVLEADTPEELEAATSAAIARVLQNQEMAAIAGVSTRQITRWRLDPTFPLPPVRYWQFIAWLARTDGAATESPLRVV